MWPLAVIYSFDKYRLHHKDLNNAEEFTSIQPSRFGSVVAHPDLDGEVSGSSPGHTKVFKNVTYCSSACAGHNELE